MYFPPQVVHYFKPKILILGQSVNACMRNRTFCCQQESLAHDMHEDYIALCHSESDTTIEIECILALVS